MNFLEILQFGKDNLFLLNEFKEKLNGVKTTFDVRKEKDPVFGDIFVVSIKCQEINKSAKDVMDMANSIWKKFKDQKGEVFLFNKIKIEIEIGNEKHLLSG